MSKPVPSAPQIAAINQAILEIGTQAAAMQESANQQTAIITQKGLIDDAFKDLFAWYNDAVIGRYDAERRAINGSYVASPVTEADITGVAASPPTGRLVPTPPATAIVRIAEFDGGAYTSTDTNNELQRITDETNVITYLVSGVPGGSPTVNATTVTASSFSSASTSLDVEDPTDPLAFAIGDVILVSSGGDAGVAVVTSVTDNMGGDPPYEFTLGVTVVIPPAGSIGAGAAVLAGFSGFTNGERTTKTASVPDYQPIMDALVAQLQAALNARLTTIGLQLTALGANDDPDGVADITTAQSNATAAQSFISGYLPGTDISDTGIGLLTTEYTGRMTYLSTRVSQIIAAYTGQTENYYDARYTTANNRGDTFSGSLRAKSNAQNVQTQMNTMAAQLTAQVAQLNSILP